MTNKNILAAILFLVAALFIPHAAFAAEQNIDAESIVRTGNNDARLDSSEGFGKVKIARDSDLSLRAAALPAVVPFEDMWTLIVKYQRLRQSHFSPELIAALFWEESAFRMVQHPASGAVGFGQVLPSTLRAVNKRFGTTFTRHDLLTSREASVEASVLALELAWEWKRDKTSALAAYAGGAPNQHIVRKWLAAESAMVRGRIPYGNSFGLQSYMAQHQIHALRIVSQPGFDPQVIFD